MPLTKQAIKKSRHDKTVTTRHKKTKTAVKIAIKTFKKQPTQDALASVFSVLDKTAKTNFLHKNKASRLKSRLSKMVATPKS